MAVEILQRPGGISHVEDSSAEATYLISGTEDPVEAMDALTAEAALNPLLTGLERANGKVELLPGCLDKWQGTIVYARAGASASLPRKPLKLGEQEIRFRTASGSRRVFQAVSHIASYGTSPPNHGGLINVVTSGGVQTVNGVDTPVGYLDFELTKVFVAGTLTDALVVQFGSLVGCTNAATWHTFPAEYVRFNGANGGKRGDGSILLTFSFSTAPAFAAQTINGISVAAQTPWTYLWQETREIASGAITVQSVIAVHAEQVLPMGDFTILGV